MSKIDLNLRDLSRKDLENLEQIQKNINGNPLSFGNWKRFEVVETGAVTDKSLAHGLGAVPTDVIVSYQSGGTISFSYASFTKEALIYTTSAGMTARFYVGYY